MVQYRSSFSAPNLRVSASRKSAMMRSLSSNVLSTSSRNTTRALCEEVIGRLADSRCGKFGCRGGIDEPAQAAIHRRDRLRGKVVNFARAVQHAPQNRRLVAPGDEKENLRG